MCCREGLNQLCLQRVPRESGDQHNLTATACSARCAFTFTYFLGHKYLAAHVFAKIIPKQHSVPGETMKTQTAHDRYEANSDGFTSWHLQTTGIVMVRKPM